MTLPNVLLGQLGKHSACGSIPRSEPRNKHTRGTGTKRGQQNVACLSKVYYSKTGAAPFKAAKATGRHFVRHTLGCMSVTQHTGPSQGGGTRSL